MAAQVAVAGNPVAVADIPVAVVGSRRVVVGEEVGWDSSQAVEEVAGWGPSLVVVHQAAVGMT